TAVYGTVRTVVWEEGRRKAPSYPIQIDQMRLALA
ncbi:hypothetical protein PMI09_06036, partial [Rhizobium sp. CF122]